MIVVSVVVPPFLLSSAQGATVTQLSPSDDSWIEYKHPDANKGSDPTIHAKVNTTNVRRSYLKFDLSGLPSGKVLTDVKLYLYCTAKGKKPYVQIDVNETADNWNEGNLTWNNAPAVGAFVTSTTVDGTGIYYSWNITSYAQAQYEGDKILSVVVKLPQDDPTQLPDLPKRHRDFASKENTDPNKHPYIEITYTAPPPPALSVSISPTSVTMNLGQYVTFTSNVSGGTPPYSYQWFLNDTAVPGANAGSWTFTPTSTGFYTVYVNVTDNVGVTAKSNIASVTVNPALSVSISPTSATIDLGQSKTFTSTVSGGTPPYSYQWFLNDTAVSGATASSWTFTPTSAGFYTVYLNVTDGSSATAKSNVATVTVNPALAVSISPTNVVIDLGQSVTFNSIVSGGTSPYFYQWYLNGTPVSGATNPSWTFTPTSTGFYRVYVNVSDSADVDPWATSNIANVTVNPQLTASISPPSATITLGQSVLFNSTVSGGTPPYSYQWDVNGTWLPGETNPTFNFTPTQPGYYNISLLVTDSAGANASAFASVTVQPLRYYLTVQTDPPGLSPAPTPPSNWYVNCTYVNLTAPEYANVSADTRYRFDYWDVNGTSQGVNVKNITVHMDANYTATAHYVLQYLVTFNQTGLDATANSTVVTVNGAPKNYGDLPFSMWADNGSSVTYNYSAIVSSTVSGKRFRLDSISSPPSPFTVTGPVTITGNYKTQYQLTVRTNGLGTNSTNVYNNTDVLGTATDATPYSDWFDDGSSLQLNIDSPITVGSTRFVFTQWSGDATGTSRPLSVTMNSAKDITANYKTQYKVTFSQSGVGTDFTGTVVTIDGTGYNVNDLPASFWWNKNSQHNFSFASPLVVNASKQYVWISTSGLSTSQSDTLTITNSGSITGYYSTGIKYQITFDQTGVGSDFNDTIVIIDGIPYNRTTLPVSFWWDFNSNHTFAFQSPLVVTLNAKQYVWNSTSGLSSLQSGSINVSTSGNVIGNYKTQYYLTMSTNFGTVTPDSDWYDAGATVQINASAPSVVGGERYVWLGWTGTGTGSYSGMDNPASITMNSPITETAAWRHEYKLTVTSPYDSPTPTTGWFEAGTSITASVTSPVSGPSGTRYVCTGWTGTGSVPPSGTTKSVTFTINAPSSITWNWKSQYLLTVRTDPTGLSPQPTRSPAGEAGSGGWWYDSTTSVQLTAQSVAGYDFLNWDVDTTPVSGNPITVPMDGPHVATAHYKPKVVKPPVGGYAAPIEIAIGKEASHLLASQIGLAFALLAAMAATILLARRRSKTLK